MDANGFDMVLTDLDCQNQDPVSIYYAHSLYFTNLIMLTLISNSVVMKKELVFN